MQITFQKEKLEKVIQDFYNVTKIRIGIVDADLNWICALPHSNDFCDYIQKHGGIEMCYECDRSLLNRCSVERTAQTHICYAGLLDAGVPIVFGEKVVGYIIMGRICTETKFEEIYARVSHFSIGRSTLYQHYRQLTHYNTSQVQSAVNLVLMLTTYILSQDMVLFQPDLFAQRIAEYVAQNLAGDLSIQRLCAEMHVSKNILYKHFRESFGCSVNEYVTARRIHQAKRLLVHGQEPVSVICEKVGIRNYSYFCRLFLQKVGTSPLRYRKENTTQPRNPEIKARL